MQGDTGSSRRIPIWILGAGGVGCALLEMLCSAELRRNLQERAGLELAPLLVADSQACLFEPAGLSDGQLRGILDAKVGGVSLLNLPGARAVDTPLDCVRLLETDPGIGGSIGIDVTASDQTTPALLYALSAGSGIVLANKRPLSGTWESFRALTGGRRCRHEATVGAGLPVIATLESLLDSGDRVLSIQGCFSGTLGYLCSELSRGRPYSAAVRGAMDAGYSEPDPRDDLNGTDMARKTLILSRMLGQEIELADVLVDPLIPVCLRGLDLDTFLLRLPEADEEMAARVGKARERGAELRYVADLSGSSPRIGLREVEATSPIGLLSGTDNIVVFSTERYRETPLVIQGPGAGRDVTAAGVWADMVNLGPMR